MARKPTGNPTGRPLRDFDNKIFEGLCRIACTMEEIEQVFRTDYRTVDKWCKRTYNADFSTTYKNLASEGKASLRRNQFNLSKKNASMAIWLGKQWLGQRDEPQRDAEFDGTLKQLLNVFGSLESPEDFKSEPQKKEPVQEVRK